MKSWPAILLLVFLVTSSASAQQWSSARNSWPQPPPAYSDKAVARVEAAPYPGRTAPAEAAQRHSSAPEAEPEDDPLGHYHFVHNERIHRLRQRAWRNVFADRVYLFDYWYTSRKGITLLHFRRGRLRLGFETQRVQVPGDARRSSGPARAMDACHAFASYQSGICRPLYFREGERRYSVTLRWNFGR
jgi:hypothetical protein